MPISPDGRNGWEIYNVQREYMRQGVGVRTKAWRFTDINKDYSVSEAILRWHYKPKRLVILIPSSLRHIPPSSSYRHE